LHDLGAVAERHEVADSALEFLVDRRRNLGRSFFRERAEGAEGQ
jgi:hypothetical protein